MIGVVDYGIGNLASLVNMFDYLDIDAEIVSDPKRLLSCDKIVIPGVGAFDAAVSAISKVPGLRATLDELALVERRPFLGVCLGMQLMTNASEEGELKGFGWIAGQCQKMEPTVEKRVPHMGWNRVNLVRNSLLLENVGPEDRFYFVHSYFVKVTNTTHSVGVTNHIVEFDSVVERENLFGVQFHPEKSHRHGMKVLSNFGRL